MRQLFLRYHQIQTLPSLLKTTHMTADIISSKALIKSPGPGTGVTGATYYTQATGNEMLCCYHLTTRDDTSDVAYTMRSQDNGRTWDAPQIEHTHFKDPQGSGRYYSRGMFVDPHTNKTIQLWNQAVLPTDDPLEGMRQWYLIYATSDDGGRTHLVKKQIIHKGDQYNAQHHLPGITVGKNAAMLGDQTQTPFARHDGVILVPVQITPTGPDGDYHNPGAGYTYTNCIVLIGKWQADGSLEWTASDPIIADPARTTRGIIEPTIAALNNNKLLMVMRGSNDANVQWPGHKWFCTSSDGGQSWTTPQPWHFNDGSVMYSPSSCSQLVTHSSGRLFWVGNQCKENPKGNNPRHPLVLIEVDKNTGMPMGETLSVIDDKKPDESHLLCLSNFYCLEDRQTGDLLVQYPRSFAHADADRHNKGQHDFSADLTETRMKLR